MLRKRQWVRFLFLGMLVFSMGAYAETLEQIQEQVEALVMDRHPKRNAEFWLTHAQSAPQILRKMYTETTSIYKKARILESLAWYRGAENTRFLKSVAGRETHSLVISRAIRSIAVSQGLQEEKYLTQMAHHLDPGVRKEALQLLERLHQKGELTHDAKKDEPLPSGRLRRVRTRE